MNTFCSGQGERENGSAEKFFMENWTFSCETIGCTTAFRIKL